MDYLPPPDVIQPNRVVMEQCVGLAAQRYQLPAQIIQAIALTEGGASGYYRKNTNNTLDLGIMQINSSNIRALQKEFPGITAYTITLSPCTNILVGAYWLKHKIKSAGNFWKGVGWYHSATPKYKYRYLKRVKRSLQQIEQSNGQWVKLLQQKTRQLEKRI